MAKNDVQNVNRQPRLEFRGVTGKNKVAPFSGHGVVSGEINFIWIFAGITPAMALK